jgi:hypothetical protein
LPNVPRSIACGGGSGISVAVAIAVVSVGLEGAQAARTTIAIPIRNAVLLLVSYIFFSSLWTLIQGLWNIFRKINRMIFVSIFRHGSEKLKK